MTPESSSQASIPKLRCDGALVAFRSGVWSTGRRRLQDSERRCVVDVSPPAVEGVAIAEHDLVRLGRRTPQEVSVKQAPRAAVREPARAPLATDEDVPLEFRNLLKV